MSSLAKLPSPFTAGTILRMILIGVGSYLFVTLTSCRTPQTINQGEIKIDTTLHTKEAETGLEFSCDSLKAKYDSLARSKSADTVKGFETVIIHDTIKSQSTVYIVPRKGVLIHSDSLVDVYYSVKSNGNLSFKVKVKPQPVHFTAEKKVDFKCPECPKPNLFYVLKEFAWLWCLCIIAGVFGAIMLPRLR